MNIVILDGCPLNSGDLDWSIFGKFGEVSVYKNTVASDVIDRAKDADIIIANKIVFTEKVFSALPNLKFLAITATGYNNIDLEAAKKFNVTVSNVPLYSKNSVAQLNVALMLELAIGLCKHNSAVKNDMWTQSEYFSFHLTKIVEVEGKTAGFFGFGNIGQRTAKTLKALGMRTIFYNKSVKEVKGSTQVDLDTLLENSDFLFLTCPLTKETEEIVDKDFIKKMRRNSFLINCARGALIKEQELANALNTEKIAGYAADVLSTEPPKKDNPLLSAKNCIITPHIAWQSYESRKRLMQETFKNVATFIAGNPVNVVS